MRMNTTTHTTKIQPTALQKAYTTIVNTLHGNHIQEQWDVPTVEESWSWGAEYALVRLSDGNTYRVHLELTDNGYTI